MITDLQMLLSDLLWTYRAICCYFLAIKAIKLTLFCSISFQVVHTYSHISFGKPPGTHPFIISSEHEKIHSNAMCEHDWLSKLRENPGHDFAAVLFAVIVLFFVALPLCCLFCYSSNRHLVSPDYCLFNILSLFVSFNFVYPDSFSSFTFYSFRIRLFSGIRFNYSAAATPSILNKQNTHTNTNKGVIYHN